MPADGYRICPVFDQFKPSKSGVAIRVQLCDAAGKNLSTPGVGLTIQSLVGPPNGVKPPLPSLFHYEPSFAGYEAFQSAGLLPGAYIVYFTAAGDLAPHMVQFRIG